MNKITKQIEALLYYLGGSMKKKELAKLLEAKESDITDAIEELKEKRKDSGVVLLDVGESITLATSDETKASIEKYVKKEMKGSIGRAGAETLSIIAYIGPVSRSVIEYIRGVHSQFIIQRLLLRGLIKRQGEGRNIKYTPTVELLSHMGVKSLEELPDFEETRTKLLEVLESRNESMKKDKDE